MVMALYSDTGGRPSALLAQTAVVTLNNSTQEIPPLAPVALAAGTYWILAVYDIGASVGFDQSNGAAVVQYISFNFGGALPNQIQNPTTYMGQQFNYYIGVQ
jgi:hypothetical protein